MSRRRSFALALALAIGVAACHRAPHTDAPPDATAPLALTASATPSALTAESATATATPSLAPDASAAASLEPDGNADAPFLSGVPVSAKAIGHTSIVFKLELSTGKKAAFKPASRRGPLRYKGEIAARRLALGLGLLNVPRVFFRAFEASSLAAAKGADELIAKDGVVKGALIPWIPDLAFLALEQAPLSGEWKQWLRKGTPIPEDKRDLAQQISTLVAFDYVTGNWDRWSGGNVGIAKDTGTLLYIDNDGAFFEVPPQEGLQRNKKLLAGIDRFSRGFIARMRLLDEAEITRAIGEEAPGVPLLSAKALAGVFQRRRELLEIVDAKLSSAGDAATFELP